ncbi:MAG: hypothetical protein WC248_07225 [Candidatus Methanomethylophilaceae archaeon]|jgi:hypothetical protein
MSEPSISSPTTKKCFIAYLDLLGTKDKIGDPQSLAAISYIYRDVLEKSKAIHLDDNSRLNVKIFSDNILISIEVNPDYEESLSELDYLLHFVTYFQLCAMTYAAWLLRGCITMGELYVDTTDNVFVWGKGLVHAYELESKKAIYPRVIIDRQNTELSSRLAALYIKYPSSAINIVIDSDRCEFLSFEDLPLSKSEVERLSGLQDRYASLIDDYVKTQSPDPKIQQKIHWIVNYHNYVCTKKNHPEYIVDVTLLLKGENNGE